jgi:hypothetical protein
MGGYSGLPNGFVPGGTASLVDIVTGFGQQKADIAHSQAAARSLDTGAQLTQAQIPGVQEVGRQEAIKTKAAQQRLDDQDIIRRGYISAAGLPPEQVPGAVRDFALRNKISAPGFQEYQLHDLDLRTRGATLSKDERENQDALHQQAGELLNAVGAIADPAQRRAAYARTLPSLQAKAPDIQWKSPDQLQPDDIPLYQAGLNHAVAILGQSKTKQEIETQKAIAVRHTAQGREFDANATRRTRYSPAN